MAGSRMFQQIEGETAIIVEGGVYKEADIYTRNDGELFAKISSGYIRLYADGATSKGKCRLDTLQIDGKLTKDQFGKLCLGDGPKRKPIESQPSYLGLDHHEG